MYLVETLFPELEQRYTTRVYFGLGDNGQIKIGLTGRPSGHRGGEMHFTDLCTEPGDRLVEHRYHAKYATERIGKTEWFYLSNRLLFDLIAMCVQQGRVRSVETLKAIALARLEAVRHDGRPSPRRLLQEVSARHVGPSCRALAEMRPHRPHLGKVRLVRLG